MLLTDYVAQMRQHVADEDACSMAETMTKYFDTRGHFTPRHTIHELVCDFLSGADLDTDDLQMRYGMTLPNARSFLNNVRFFNDFKNYDFTG